MAAQGHPYIGWTIAEAIEKVVSPTLQNELSRLAAEAAGAVNRARSNQGSWLREGRLYEPDNSGTIAQNREATARAAVHSALREILRSGQLVAWGHEKDVTGAWQEIRANQWPSLTAIDEGASTAREGHSGPRFSGVAIFPILEAPEAARAIAGKELSAILRAHVFGDPEIVNLCAKTTPGTDPATEIMVSKDGPSLTPIVEDSAEIVAALDLPQAMDGLRRPIASRLAAFARVLTSGTLTATGYSAAENSEDPAPIESAIFERLSTRLCVRTGDLWRVGDDPRRIYTRVRVNIPKGANSQAMAAAAELKPVLLPEKKGPAARKAFAELLARELKVRGHRFTTKKQVVIETLEIMKEQTKSPTAGEANEADVLQMTRFLRDHFTPIWDLFEQGSPFGNPPKKEDH